MFIPLAKADAAQRLVYGSFDETPDRAREVCDYATAKPAFEAWSEALSKASEGKSLGNIRGQHSNIAAGKLVELTFDDMTKSIGFVAKIVDDNEWKKVEEGVYTGFSPGGKYAKRWKDGDFTRYTPDVRELSIVDVPCNPNATFTMVKADGTEADVEFVMAKAYEPGNEATKARADDLAKAAGKDGRGKDFVVQARADLIAENATAALEKMAGADAPAAEIQTEAQPDGADPVEALNAALAKADKGKLPYGNVKYADPEDGKYPVDTVKHIRAAWSYINMPKNQKGVDEKKVASIKANIVSAWKDKIDAKGPPEAETMTKFDDIARGIAAVGLIRSAVEKQDELTKSLGTVSDVSRLLCSMSWIADSVCWEEKYENDTDSKLPQQAADLIMSLRTFLIEMATEETAELLAGMQRSTGDVIELVIDDDDADPDDMALAASIVDLVKADTALMEKAGARNNRSDKATIQSMHDSAVALGADCGGVEKADLASVTADRDRLAKAVSESVPRVEALATRLDEMETRNADSEDKLAKALEEIEMLKAQPGETKGAVFAVDKENDGKPLAKESKTLADKIAALPNGPAKAAAILTLRGQTA